MKRYRHLACVLGLAMATQASAQQTTAQQAGDPQAGFALAQEYCSRCHDINPGGAFKLNPPSFAAIAVYRTADQITERIWFPPVHARMPPMSELLQQEDVANLTAYILSLEGQ